MERFWKESQSRLNKPLNHLLAATEEDPLHLKAEAHPEVLEGQEEVVHQEGKCL